MSEFSENELFVVLTSKSIDHKKFYPKIYTWNDLNP